MLGGFKVGGYNAVAYYEWYVISLSLFKVTKQCIKNVMFFAIV